MGEAVDEHEDAEEQYERRHGQARPDEDHDAERDCDQPSHEDTAPVQGDLHWASLLLSPTGVHPAGTGVQDLRPWPPIPSGLCAVGSSPRRRVTSWSTG